MAFAAVQVMRNDPLLAAPAARRRLLQFARAGDWGHAFGTLPKRARCEEIIARGRIL